MTKITTKRQRKSLYKYNLYYAAIIEAGSDGLDYNDFIILFMSFSFRIFTSLIILGNLNSFVKWPSDEFWSKIEKGIIEMKSITNLFFK